MNQSCQKMHHSLLQFSVHFPFKHVKTALSSLDCRLKRGARSFGDRMSKPDEGANLTFSTWTPEKNLR